VPTLAAFISRHRDGVVAAVTVETDAGEWTLKHEGGDVQSDGCDV